MKTLASECVCELPGGLINDQGQRLSIVKLRPLTGVVEDWLVANPGVSNALAVTHIVSSCLVLLDGRPVNEELVRNLLVGDRDYLMLQLRRITFGEQIQAVLNCPACFSKMDIDFCLQDVPVERHPQTATVYEIEHSGRSFQFRLPVGGDQESVQQMSPMGAANALLARCVVSDDGEALSPEESSAIVVAMESQAPKVDLELDLKCPECKHLFLLPFDTTAFFLNELRLSGCRLMQEIHALASHYHWSEMEILNLRRDRRQSYLEMICNAMSPATEEVSTWQTI